MKFKKLLFALGAALALFGAANYVNPVQADQVNPPEEETAPSKEEILRRSTLNAAHSLRTNYAVQIKLSRRAKLNLGLTVIMGNNGQIGYSAFKIGKTKIKMWATPKILYLKSGKKWEKISINPAREGKHKKRSINFKKVRKIKHFNLAERLKLSSALYAMDEKFFDATQVSQDDNNYTLTLANNPQLNRELLEAIFKYEGLSKKELKQARHLKIDNYSHFQIISKDSYQLQEAKYTLAMHYQKISFKGTETIDNINQYNDLQIPRAVIKHAKKAK